MFWFDVAVPFSAEGWRGRMRACRGVGATLDAAQVAAFDAEHAAALMPFGDRFDVLHCVDAHVFRMR